MAGLGAVDGAVWRGTIAGIISAACYAGCLLCLERSGKSLTWQESLGSAAGLALTAAGVLGLESFAIGESLALGRYSDWLIVGGYGICAQVLAWGLITFSLSCVPAKRAALLFLLQPCLAYIWDVALFGKTFSALESLGALFVLLGLLLSKG